MRRNLALSFLLCIVLCVGATTGFAQSRLDGKWATDRPADPLTLTDDQRKESVQLELTIEDANAPGTLTIGGLGGSFYTLKDVSVTGDQVRFRIVSGFGEPLWDVQMLDDNTVVLRREPIPIALNNMLDLTVLGGPVPNSAILEQGGTSGSLTGIIQDSTKARIPGVKVTAIDTNTGVMRTAVTDDAGRYSFPKVLPGKYKITASVPGFITTTVYISIDDRQFMQDFSLELPAALATSCNPNGIVWCNILHRAK